MPRITRLTVLPWAPNDVSTKPCRKCPASPEITQPLSSRMLPPGVISATVLVIPFLSVCSPSSVFTVPVNRILSSTAKAIFLLPVDAKILPLPTRAPGRIGHRSAARL